jgi:hypothetical protein
MDHLHWWSWLAKLSAILCHCLTCLGHLGRHNTDRIASIYVTPPKVAKASKACCCCWCYRANFCKWKHGLSDDSWVSMFRLHREGFCFVYTLVQNVVLLCSQWPLTQLFPEPLAGGTGKCSAHRHLRKIDWFMACTACLVCLVSTVSGHCKNAHGRGSASSGHITN